MIQFGQQVLSKFLKTVIFLKFFRSLMPNQQLFIPLTWDCSGKFFNWLTSIIFSNFFFFSNWDIKNLVKKWTSFFEKKKRFFDWHIIDMITRVFFRESSEYLQHSVLSPKRFGQLEMKLEQKARPSPKRPFLGGVRGVPQRT